MLVIGDLFIVIGSIFLSSIVVVGVDNGLRYIMANYISFCVTSGIYSFIFYLAGLYDLRKDFRDPYYLFSIVCASIVAFIIAAFCFYVNWSLRLGRGIFLGNGLLIPFLLISWRYIYSILISQPQFQKKSLIVGAGWAGKTVLEAIKDTKGHGLHIMGFIDDDKSKIGSKIDGMSILGSRYDLLAIVKKQKIRQVIVAITHEKHVDLLKELVKCSQDGVVIKDMITLYESLTGKIPFKHVNDLWFYDSLSQQSTFHVQRVKRGMDIVLSFLILLVSLPALPVIAFLIKKSSMGGVFYVQERIGKDRKTFKIIKFRSMVHNAEEETGAVYAKDDDDRITKIGKVLRKWRVDEIPQLINVIKGDMSLIGPRPERKKFIDMYEKEIPFYAQRLTVQPGITGWAQTKFQYASSLEHTEEKLQYDLYYIKNMSFTLDVVILLKTIKVILFGTGK
ncbi:MAG: sugar transferase [Candidatus Anammoxibacter sp.]